MGLLRSILAAFDLQVTEIREAIRYGKIPTTCVRYNRSYYKPKTYNNEF